MDSQRCFRSILAAMAEPGTMHGLDADVDAPPELSTAAALVLLVLADHETPVWLESGFTEAASFLLFHTGARRVEQPIDARFAVVGGAGTVDLAAFDQGDARYPDRSATVIVQCTSLTDGPPVNLAGPGIRDQRSVAPLGVATRLWSELAENAARYPLGVDLVLAAGRDILCLPRSTRIVRAPGDEMARERPCTLR
jgi:alpha-D-ribose 1-methylphosphonate 5-triphosphate synthase subunit PhnH